MINSEASPVTGVVTVERRWSSRRILCVHDWSWNARTGDTVFDDKKMECCRAKRGALIRAQTAARENPTARVRNVRKSHTLEEQNVIWISKRAKRRKCASNVVAGNYYVPTIRQRAPCSRRCGSIETVRAGTAKDFAGPKHDNLLMIV